MKTWIAYVIGVNTGVAMALATDLFGFWGWAIFTVIYFVVWAYFFFFEPNRDTSRSDNSR